MEDHGRFGEVKLTKENLDVFVQRNAIARCLRAEVGNFSGKLLDIGCGQMPYKAFILAANDTVTEYIGLDLDNDYAPGMKPDLTWDGKNIPLEDGSVDTVMLTEVLEHCPEPETVLKEAHRVLSEGGLLFFTVPFLWPLHATPHDEYRYTPFSLERHFKNSGFKKLEIKAMGGWNASLAQMIGLWVNRAATGRAQRMARPWAKRFINYLVKNDHVPADFKQDTMVTGFYGTCNK